MENGMMVGLFLFAGAFAILLLFLLDIGFAMAAEEWQARRRPPERPRFPWTDRTGT